MAKIKIVYKIGDREFTRKEDAEEYADGLSVVTVQYHPDLNSGTGKYYDHISFAVGSEYCSAFLILLKSYLYRTLNTDGVQGWFAAATEPFVITVQTPASEFEDSTVFLDFRGLNIVKNAKKYIAEHVQAAMAAEEKQ